MGYTMCDTDDVEAVNGVFRPIRRALGVTAFGINQEELPPNGDAYPDHDHAEDGQEEVFYVLDGAGKMVVDGEDVELKPGRYVCVEAGSKRKILPGDEGLRMICVGSPPGAYQRTGGVASAASTSATPACSRARFAASFSQPEAPDGMRERDRGGACPARSSRRLRRSGGGFRAADEPRVRRR